jgi:hypothetical protein
VALDVRFTRICDFDVCAESGVFDLFDIMLVHGWLPDGADAATAAAVDGRTHRGCRERLQALRRAGQAGGADAAALAAFLAAGMAAGGMSPGGLSALLAGVPDRQLCVLYRGGEFHAAFKREDAFYLLLTDEPLGPGATPPGAVWEELAEAHGANALIDAAFCGCMGPGGEEPLRRAPIVREVEEEAAAPAAAAAAPAGAEASGSGAGPSGGAVGGAGGPAAVRSAAMAGAPEPAATARLAAAYAASSGGQQAEHAAATARDHALALRLQETFEEQERAARKAVRAASSRLQLQQERGAGGEESAEVRALMMRIEERMGERCSLM